MTKGRATLPWRAVAGQKAFFVTLGEPQAHEHSGRDEKSCLGSEPSCLSSERSAVSCPHLAGRTPALILLVEERVVDIRPHFLEGEDTAINGNIGDPSLVGLCESAFLARIVEIGNAREHARS
jgi:hypothetical protein